MPCSDLEKANFYRFFNQIFLRRYEARVRVEEDETYLGSVDSDLLRRGDKVRVLHHQPKDFTQEARFSEKDFQVDYHAGSFLIFFYI